MKKALHLLNSFKHGGAENVALNYSIVLDNLNVSSIFVAKKESPKYIELLIKNNFRYEIELSIPLIQEVDYIFIHSNQNLFKLLKYKILGKLKIYFILKKNLDYSLNL